MIVSEKNRAKHPTLARVIPSTIHGRICHAIGT